MYEGYLSTAEVNLYLAELKLLSQGQDIGFSGNAESYLKKGVEYSMRAYDKMCIRDSLILLRNVILPYFFVQSSDLGRNEVENFHLKFVLTMMS